MSQLRPSIVRVQFTREFEDPAPRPAWLLASLACGPQIAMACTPVTLGLDMIADKPAVSVVVRFGAATTACGATTVLAGVTIGLFGAVNDDGTLTQDKRLLNT